METKPDFAEAQETWQAFWRGERRCPLVAAVVPRAGTVPTPKPSTYAEGPNLDVHAFAEAGLRWAETHHFVGAAIPFVYLEFAADQFATFLGSDLTFPKPGEGGWPTHPYAHLPLAEVEIRFQREGKWWQRIAEIAHQLMERWEGRLLIAAPTFVSNLDALVALRGANQVLLDLLDEPEAVHRALAQIDHAHAEILDAFASLLQFDRWGSINRHGMYSTGRINVPQCDFSCLISPAMFREFALPYLTREFQRLDGGEYHLDGPDAIRHLETLCGIQRLHVIQWVPGAAREREDWSHLYRRIDQLGKGLILGGPRGSLERWAREVTPGRLFWNLTASSLAEAEETVARFSG
ncbi:MAG: hypothetical protein QHJ73_01625 [Armatimonadota bacterium]|nr:hypothetical protein [Armatimonadota bacterium]